MKNTRDFISNLLSYGTEFALSFLVITGLAIVTAVFVIVLIVASFFERVLN